MRLPLRFNQWFVCTFLKYGILLVKSLTAFFSYRADRLLAVVVVTVVCSWDPQNHTYKLSEALRAAVITVDWQRNNKTVFKSVHFAGYVGILTAIKPVCFRVVTREIWFGCRSFRMFRPKIWNELPQHLQSTDTREQFK